MKQLLILYYLNAEHRLVVQQAIEQSILEKQDELLDKFMDTCDLSALVLPEYMCRNMVKRLVRSGKVHVFIGNEVYNNITWGYSLRGFVSRFLQRRIKGMEASGIWNWWQQFIESQHSIKGKEDITAPPTKPSMAGNVLLLFGLHMAGLIFSTVCFIHESWKPPAIALTELIITKVGVCLIWMKK